MPGIIPLVTRQHIQSVAYLRWLEGSGYQVVGEVKGDQFDVHKGYKGCHIAGDVKEWCRQGFS